MREIMANSLVRDDVESSVLPVSFALEVEDFDEHWKLINRSNFDEFFIEKERFGRLLDEGALTVLKW